MRAMPQHSSSLEGAYILGALIMLGTMFGLIVLIFTLVLRYDPQARNDSKSKREQ